MKHNRKENITKKASVIIVTYNSKKWIKNCLDSVLQNNPLEIIIVDNGSTDGTIEFLEQNYPQIILIKSKKNLGYGKAVNLGAKYAKGKYLVILNPDTKVEKNWLYELLKPLEKYDKLITTPKKLSYDGSRIDDCGLTLHFTGLAFPIGFGDSDINKEEYVNFRYVSGLSGTCFAIKKQDFIELGGFDENIFLYHEDVELSWRAHMKGFKILYVPTSIMYHHQPSSISLIKIYYVEKGRYITLKKYFTLKWYLLLFPSLLMTEILTWGYAILNGIEGIKFKIKAILESFNIYPNKIEGKAKKLRELFRSLDSTIPTNQLLNNMVLNNKVGIILIKMINRIFEWNLRRVIQ